MTHFNFYLQNIFFKKTNKTIIQLFRYIFLGNISNIADFSILYILTDVIKVHYVLSAAISFIIGVLINYLINIKWIFHRGKYSFHNELILIIIVSLVGMYLSIIIIYVFVEYINFHYMVSKVISSIFVMFWNFYSRKKWIFR